MHKASYGFLAQGISWMSPAPDPLLQVGSRDETIPKGHAARVKPLHNPNLGEWEVTVIGSCIGWAKYQPHHHNMWIRYSYKDVVGCMSIARGKSSMDTMRDLCTTSRPAFQKDVTPSAYQVWKVDYPCALQLSHCAVHPHCKQCSWISKRLKLDKRLGESLASTRD